MDYKEIIEKITKESIEVKTSMSSECLPNIIKITELISNSLLDNGTVFLFGNGGSAADAQHVAAEFVGRFKKDRKPLPAEALTTNTSAITAIGNDYDFIQIFSRQVKARVKPKDVVVGISTSGMSKNVLEGLFAAKKIGANTIGFTGSNNNLNEITDVCLNVPSNNTARIQEAHILCWHIICDIIEQKMRE